MERARVASTRVLAFVHDGEGFSSVGVALALLVTLALVFTGAQVYQVQSASAEIQEVADAAALAADNVVAEYYLAARLCDAVVLSLALTGAIAMGLGVAALCAPLTVELAPALLEAGEKVLRARDSFAQRAAEGLSRLQVALPLLAAGAAARVAATNAGALGASFIGLAILVPLEGGEIDAGELGAADELADAVEGEEAELERAARAAEEAAQRALEAKERAYQADCGADPDYCMYQRAASLAGLQGADNPRFSSVETWSFAAALDRAQAYYPRRLAQESPEGSSVRERARSALRKRFYQYAVTVVSKGYVRESDSSFEANFPLLPRNTAEMRETPLYTEVIYPITASDGGAYRMHAFSGCPDAGGSLGLGSLAQLEAGGFETCPACEFSVSSMGNIAAASTNTANGFEHYYRIVAQEAKAYEQARNEYLAEAGKVKGAAQPLFEAIVESLGAMTAQRIAVSPPGRSGAVAIVASFESVPASQGFASRFVLGDGVLGARLALSAATLVSDAPEQGRTVISSLLDGLRERSKSSFAGVLDEVMDLWSAVLYAYAEGQAQIERGLDELSARLPLASASGLGMWGSRQFSALMHGLGLQPAEMDAPKPVLVNSGVVLQADGSGFGARLLSLKRAAGDLSGADALSGAISSVERWMDAGIAGFEGEILIAQIEILGEGGPSLPLTIALPESMRHGAQGVVGVFADRLRGLASEITGVRQWR